MSKFAFISVTDDVQGLDMRAKDSNIFLLYTAFGKRNLNK